MEEIISSATLRAQPITKDHIVQVDIAEQLPVVRVDQRAVSEVLYTLIDNAAKFSPAGAVIRISAARAGNADMRMAVEDEGVGIPPELRERVFDKFFRATRDGDISTHQPSGTGMGLAIAKGIVEAHAGQIAIESGPDGKGTRVVFTLPLGDKETTEQNEATPTVAE